MAVDLEFQRVIDPERRLRMLVEAAHEGASSDDPIEDAILRAFRGDTDIPVEVLRALELYSDEYWRNVAIALLLVGAELTDLGHLLNIERQTAVVFSRYLFDRSALADYPDVYNYVHHEIDKSAPGQEFMEFALELGLEFLRAKIRPDIYTVTSAHAVSRAMTLAFTRMAEYGSSPNPRLAEEARKWADTMCKTVQLGVALEAEHGGDVEELIIALQAKISREPKQIEAIDILH